MTDDRDPRWREIDALLDRLFDTAPERREAILREVEARDPELARDARRLVTMAEEIDLPPGGALATGLLRGIEAGRQTGSTLGEQIGPWRLVGELGHGGMGRVYVGERTDGQFEQRVALKLLPAGRHSDELLHRFEQERQILARLDHPYIARLLDGGTTTEGQPWFAMELVDGCRIDIYCDRQRLTVDERLRLFVTVAEAVHAAHRSLVLHRDLKPANILVTPAGEVKLLDFGIAKPLDASNRTADATRTLHRMLTPSYATPEQIRGESLTTASDVYQLGLLLYELLTGRRAHRLEDTTLQAIERVVCETPPTRPSLMVLERTAPESDGEGATALAAARDTTPARLARRLRGDLDTILLNALRKEPERRYLSAEQLAADVRHHLDGMPIAARKDTPAYHAVKFVRRHAAGVATAVAVLAIVAALVTFYTARLQDERDRARAEAAKAEQVAEFLGGVFRLSDPRESMGEEVSVRAALDRGAEQVESALSDQPAVQAELMDVLGRTYLELGDFEAAHELLERALDLRRRHLGPDDPDVAETLRHIGLLWHQQGAYERAEPLYQEAVRILERSLGPEALELGAVLNNLGLVYRRTGEYGKGIRAFERALAIREHHLGPGAVDVGKVVNNLGILLFEMGKDERARTHYERALAIYERQLGPDHPMVASATGNLGMVRQRLGDYEGLEPMFRRTLAIHRKAYGPSHTKFGTALNNFGGFLVASGRHDEAIEVLEEAARVYREALGPEHPYVAYPLLDLGDLYLSVGRPTEALPYLRRATTIRETALGPEHPLLAGCLETLGRAQAELGEAVDAERNLRRAVAIRRQPGDPDEPRLATSLLSLGRFLSRRGRCAEAVPLLNEAATLRQQDTKTGEPDLAEIRELLRVCSDVTASTHTASLEHR